MNMARYIDAETALKIIDSYAKTVSGDGKTVVEAIRDIVEIITPTADVAPRAEVAREILDELEEVLCGEFLTERFWFDLGRLRIKYMEGRNER